MAIHAGIDVGSTRTRKVNLKLTLNQVKVANGEKANRSIYCLASNLFTFRHFVFPFSDRRRLREILKEDLSENLLFPLTEAQWDFSASAGNVSVLIAYKDKLKAFKTALPANLEVLEGEPFALSRTLAFNNIKTALVIDFGASKTVFCGVKDGRLHYLRTIMRGGNALTQKLAQEQNLSFLEAEKLKLAQGCSLAEASYFLTEIIEAAAPLENYNSIFICGGGAQMLGLREWLSLRLKTDVEFLALPGGLSPFEHAVAFGAALKGKIGEEGVNFSQETKKITQNTYKTWIILGLLPLLLFSLNIAIKDAALKSQYKSYNAFIKSSIRKEFPQIKELVAPMAQAAALVEQEKKTAQGGGNLMDALGNLSQALSGKDLKLFELNYDVSGIRLKGEAGSFKIVEDFKQALSANFAKVEVGEGKTLANKRISFNLTADFQGAAPAVPQDREAEKP